MMYERGIVDLDGAIEKQALDHIESWCCKIDAIFAQYECSKCSICHFYNHEHIPNCVNKKN